jgi:hypothetical protein
MKQYSIISEAYSEGQKIITRDLAYLKDEPRRVLDTLFNDHIIWGYNSINNLSDKKEKGLIIKAIPKVIGVSGELSDLVTESYKRKTEINKDNFLQFLDFCLGIKKEISKEELRDYIDIYKQFGVNHTLRTIKNKLPKIRPPEQEIYTTKKLVHNAWNPKEKRY